MTPARILAVEDDRIIGMILEQHLTTMGYEVVGRVGTAADAVKAVTEHQPDLVLMDIMLDGEETGIQAAEEIRRAHRVPVIFLTALDTKEIVEQAKHTEAYGYILKPFQDRELAIVIEMALYRHKLERRLEERERLLQAMLTSIGDGVVAIDSRNQITFFNPVAAELTGVRAEQAIGRPVEEIVRLVSETDHEELPCPLLQAIHERRIVASTEEATIVGRQAIDRAVEFSAAPILGVGGELLGGIMTLRDVTLQRQLTYAARQLAAIVESTDAAVISTAVDRTIDSWNRAAERLLGYSAAEAIGQPITLIAPPDRLAEMRSVYDRVRNGELVPAFETFRQHKDGNQIPVMVSVSAIRSPAGAFLGTSGIIRDISHLKSLEAQFREAQKLEAVGRLAGGIAHEFNNLMTIINGYAQLLHSGSAPTDKSRELIEPILQAGKRAAGLTRQLLAYGRKQMLRLAEDDLNTLVRGLAANLARLIGDQIQLDLDLADDLDPVKIDRNQISQLLLNLTANAKDAMLGQGRILIRTRNVDSRPTATIPHFGRCVELTVADTGSGMDRNTLDHIFEPFFTTKEQGKGTGLGLPTVHGIVKQSGGDIQVESQIGKGSSFRIFFPSCRPTAATTRQVVQRPVRDARIALLVDDDPGLRELHRYLFEKYGYHVLEAGDPLEGLRIAENDAYSIDLLVIDLLAPQFDGRGLVDRLREIRPGIKILCVSNYVEAAPHDRLEGDDIKFLQKPFTTQSLAAALQTLFKPDQEPG